MGAAQVLGVGELLLSNESFDMLREALCEFLMLLEALCKLWTPVKLLLHRVR